MRLLARYDEGFDQRLIPPLVLGSLLNPVNSSMLAVDRSLPARVPRSPA